MRQGNRIPRSEEHTSELQSRQYLVCRLLLEKRKLMYQRDSADLWGGLTALSSRGAASVGGWWTADSGAPGWCVFFLFVFFNDTATTEIYPLSLPDALPISDT